VRIIKHTKIKSKLEKNILIDKIDMIAPTKIRFFPTFYVCGDTYRSTWAISEYQKSTEQQAILRHLGDKENITLRIYSRIVNTEEKRKILMSNFNRTQMLKNENDINDRVEAEVDMNNQIKLMSTLAKTNESLIHAAVYIEISGATEEELKENQAEVLTELSRSGITVKRLLLRQKDGFKAVAPSGENIFMEEFERILPSSSVANLFPFNYSGKTDSNGFYLGKDKYGSNIIVDFQKRTDDKTNSNAIMLGNSGQGKSYLLKLILINLRCSGMNIICLDPESEYLDLTNNLGGNYIDLMEGEYIINVLEPKLWSDETVVDRSEDIDTFKTSSLLSQHISFLKDFFACYKDFNDKELDVIEIMLQQLYLKFNIDEKTDLAKLSHIDFPKLEDFYELLVNQLDDYSIKDKKIYTFDMLQGICLSLKSICNGVDSQFFNGYTNITNSEFITFGVKGLMNVSESLKNALLFNILSYMSNELLTKGNTVGSIDEFYLFLTNKTAVEYIRNFMKRVRKKESLIILASQNLEDFNQPGITELTKPLLAIPTHQFLFNAGNIDGKTYMDTLQLEESEYELIKRPARGQCLYRCGLERYYLQVKAPQYKKILFGNTGGR
jgi:type IV secretory pathway VirB4 component